MTPWYDSASDVKWTNYIPLFNKIKILKHGKIVHIWKDQESIKNYGEREVNLEMMMEDNLIYDRVDV